jgi:hypothetical protein
VKERQPRDAGEREAPQAGDISTQCSNPGSEWNSDRAGSEFNNLSRNPMWVH